MKTLNLRLGIKIHLVFLNFVLLSAFISPGEVLAAKPFLITCNPGEVKLTDNYVVTTNTTFCTGTYNYADREENGVIIVGADNIVINGNNLVLDGRRKIGYGIYLNGHKGVTIKNFNIKNYYYAMRAENADTILIENNNISGNKATDNTFLNINVAISSAPGGGILFNQVINSTVRNNKGNNQDVGINLYYGNGNTITQNDFSSNKAWGVRLHQSTYNIISDNQVHHVNRCNNSGCDSAGVLLVNASNNNTVSGNNMTYSGDGFFIGNQYSVPSDNNLIENNDGSYSPNNAFEATFSQGNVFRGNIASNSNYGFWLGYSHHSRVENNTIQNNRTDGINIDRGSYMTLSGNTVTNNGRYGIALTYQSGTRPETSHDHTITGNTIYDNALNGIYFQDTTNSIMQTNKISGNQNGMYFTGNSSGITVSQNNIVCVSPTSKSCQYNAYNNMSFGYDVNAENNWWGTSVQSEIDTLIFDYKDNSSKGLIDYDPWLTAPAF